MHEFPEPNMIRTNGIDMAVYEMGPKDGVPVVLAHGFPELAYSWRHQLPALAAAGYRAIAPDQRGYGRSSRPEAVEGVRRSKDRYGATSVRRGQENQAHGWRDLSAFQ